MIGLFIIVVLIVFVFNILDWLLHIDMTRSRCNTYGWGNRKLFWQNFKKYKLDKNKLGDKCYWNYETNSRFHAGIIRFNNIGMLLNPIDWILVNRDMKKYNKNSEYVWEDEEDLTCKKL